MFTYTNFKSMRKDLKESAAICADVMFDTLPLGYKDLNEVFKTRLNEAKSNALKLRIAIPAEYRDINVEVAPHTLSQQIKDLDKDIRAAIWSYRNATIRVILLNSIIVNPKIKPARLAIKSLEGIVKEILITGRNEVTISQVIHSIPLNTVLVSVDGTPLPSDAWTTDEIRLQFINELVELDFLDMRITHKIQMISIPEARTSLVAPAEWNRLAEIAAVVNKKTILLEPAPVESKGMITTSSWFYETPELSPDQHKYMHIMQHTKFAFVEDAEDLVEAAYLEHLRDDSGNLPEHTDWIPARVEFLKSQIRASHANGGHYIACKWDSALRTYYMAEFGHFQTSSSLRKLVKVVGITSPVKYDMRNNVVQMYSLALGIKDLGAYVGLVSDAEAKDDLRATIARRMNEKCELDCFTKDNIKPLFMVWAYNAGAKRILEGTGTHETDFFGREYFKVRVPGLLELSGVPGTEKNREILFGIWEDILGELVPSIMALKLVFNRIIRKNPLMIASWTLPDGAIAQYASAETLSSTLYWVDSTNRRHQHTHYRKELVENARAAGLLPRVIHSLDAYFARTLVLRAHDLGIIVIPNHDSFLFDEQHIDTINDLAKELLVEILEGNYLASIIDQLNPARTSLLIKDSQGNTITSSSFGDRLTREDIMAGRPMDTEEI